MARPIKYGYVIENKHLMSLWDMEKNANIGIYPEFVSCCNNIKVWWTCPICKHSWKSRISHIFNGSSCPYCKKTITTKSNSLATLFPQIANEIISNINPETVSPFSSKRVQWKCSKCNYVWSSTIANRTRNSTCPNCHKCELSKNIIFRQNLSTCQSLKGEWDRVKNDNIDPRLISIHSNQKYWWKCKTCGHSWQESVNTRLSKGIGCPICDKKLKNKYQQKLWY